MKNWKDIFSYTTPNGQLQQSTKTFPENNKPYCLYQLNCSKLEIPIGGKYSLSLEGAHITAFLNGSTKELAEYPCHLTLSINLLANKVVCNRMDYHIYLKKDGSFYWDDRHIKGESIKDMKEIWESVRLGIGKIGSAMQAENLLNKFYQDCFLDKENDRPVTPPVAVGIHGDLKRQKDTQNRRSVTTPFLNSNLKGRKGAPNNSNTSKAKLNVSPKIEPTINFGDLALLQLSVTWALKEAEKAARDKQVVPSQTAIAKPKPMLMLQLKGSAHKFTMSQVASVKGDGQDNPMQMKPIQVSA